MSASNKTIGEFGFNVIRKFNEKYHADIPIDNNLCKNVGGLLLPIYSTIKKEANHLSNKEISLIFHKIFATFFIKETEVLFLIDELIKGHDIRQESREYMTLTKSIVKSFSKILSQLDVSNSNVLKYCQILPKIGPKDTVESIRTLLVDL